MENQEPKSFEEALSRLQVILQKLEGNEANLNQTIELYNEASGLHQYCKGQLELFQERVDIIEQNQGKVVRIEPFSRTTHDKSKTTAHDPE